MNTQGHETKLPVVISDYWAAANANLADEAAACFSSDAVVRDEGEVHKGSEAIRLWIANSTDKYHPVVSALRYEERAGQHLVAARVSGTFPGSPVELDFLFELQDGKISLLEVL